MRLASVVSNAKLARCSASYFRRASMTRPAWSAARWGSNPDNPAAMTSALTNSPTPRCSAMTLRDEVVLPAPLGPPITITDGCLPTLRSRAISIQVPWRTKLGDEGILDCGREVQAYDTVFERIPGRECKDPNTAALRQQLHEPLAIPLGSRLIRPGRSVTLHPLVQSHRGLAELDHFCPDRQRRKATGTRRLVYLDHTSDAFPPMPRASTPQSQVATICQSARPHPFSTPASPPPPAARGRRSPSRN